MAFQFAQSDKTVERAVRRIAAEEVTEACAALDDTTLPLDARIHEARKAVKKLRGLIRLVRPGLDRYAAENAALRAAGRSIAGLREAEVTQRTLSAIAGGATLSTDDSDALARPIVDRHAEEHAALDEATAAFRAAMEALAGRAASWRVEGKEFDALEAGLARTWADAGKAMKRALKRRSEDDFHDWRKRAKDHWYQARLLAPIWPAMMDPHVAAADRLLEALGEANDLSVLIRDLARGDTAEATRARLVEEAGRRRDILLAEAEILGRRLFAGPPEALTARWQVWWQVWRG